MPNSPDREHVITRMTFDLSADKPIAASYNRHAQPARQGAFDTHYALELGLVLRGGMRRFSGGVTRLCRAGDAWFCNMWEPHGYAVTRAPCDVLVIVIWPPLLADLNFAEAAHINWLAPFVAPPAQRPRTPARRRAAILELGRRFAQQDRRLAQTAAARQPRERVRLRLLLVELLLALTEDWPPQGADARAPARSGVNLAPALERVFQAQRLVTNEEAARACGLSRARFIRHFRTLMGLSFARFAQRHRLGQAASDLRRTDLPLKAIARQWGFTDESHLHRLFAAAYGCTPGEYRRNASRARTQDALNA